jgi:hypothetical protein
MIRTTLALAGSLVLASVLQAQEAPKDTTTRTLITDLTFHSNSYEPIRLFLAGGRIYRAQFTQPDIVLQMRSYEGKQLPMIVTVNLASDASGRTDFEIRPRMDGEYEFRPVYVYSGNPIRFQLWLEPRPGEGEHLSARTAVQGVEFGAELSVGVHGSYENGANNFGGKGASYSGCVTVRNLGGEQGRIWGCMLGVEFEMAGGDTAWTYLFIQPRIQILGGGASTFNGGVAIHIASGSASHGRAAGKYGMGIYAGYRERREAGGGWTVTGSLLGFRVNADDAASSGAGSWGATFGVGRYF